MTQIELTNATLKKLTDTALLEPNVYRAIICRSVAPMSRVFEFLARSRQAHRRIAILPTLAEAENWIESQRESEPA
ncbi:MAG: hypothetical protein ACR2NX_03125 [Chthoniobacterales bacterium]